ncbi:hypothetical protein PUN28_019351 [Cardiocondyla obscurior]
MRLNMTWIKLFIREISYVRSLLQKQCSARSITMEINNERVNIGNKQQYIRSPNDIPGPKALPLLGNWFRFLPYIGEYCNMNPLTLFRALHNKYGNIVKLDGLHKTQLRIFLFCPDLCKDMYRLQGNLPVRISFEPLHYYRLNREHIYNGQYGLTTSQGEAWRDFRSKVNPHMMRPETAKMHIPQMYEISSEFVDKMRGLRDSETLELPNNFMNELCKWSLELQCSIALNYRLGCLKPNLVADSEPQIMINCLNEVFDLVYRMETLPSLWQVYETRNLKKLFNVLDTISTISKKHFEEAEIKFLKTTDGTDITNRSIMEKLMHVDTQTAYTMAIDMLISFDTTCNAAGALLYFIANNMEKQKKLRKEVMSVLPDKTVPITKDVLNKTLYAKACIKESMRLFPIAIGVQRNMQSNVSIGGYMIPKGSSVVACHSLISLDPTYFLQPNEYIPERWLRDYPEFLPYKTTNPYVYMPFGYGVRTCIGRRFAELGLEILLLHIIRNFQVEWHHGPLEHMHRIINVVTTPLQFKLIDL